MERTLKANFKSFLKEAMPGFSVCIVVHRFQSFTGGTLDGVSPDRKNNDLNIPMRARVYQITQQDVLDSAGYLQVGDVKTITISDIVGFDNNPLNVKQGDFMTYDGMDYAVKGKPKKTQVGGGRIFTETLWRRK